MLLNNSSIGGEGNGGVIVPMVHPGRDALTGAALIMALMAESKKTISELVCSYPERFMIKRSIPAKENSKIDLEGLTERLNPIIYDNRDGHWFGLNEGFVHIRQSNTEPIVRIITEGNCKESAESLSNIASEFIR
jgi:phosphomannomutase